MVDSKDSGKFDDELIEIERASAILHHRDPGQAARVVSELRAREAESQRREEAARKIRETAAKRRRIRRARIGIIVGALAIGGLGAIPLTQAIMHEAERAEALQAALTKTAKPVTALGFTVGEEWLDVPPAGVMFDIPRNTCSVLLGVAEGAERPLRIRVSRPDVEPIDAQRGFVWCSCDKEKVTASFLDSSHMRLALRLLTAKMGDVGGIEVVSGFNSPGFVVMSDNRAHGCADAAFATWAQSSGHGRLDALEEGHKEHVEPYRLEQFVPLGRFSKDKRFAVVPSRKDHCYFAFPVGKKMPITLRDTEGQRLIQDSIHAMGWCTYKKDRTHSLWRKEIGSPDMFVVEVQAKRVGGLTGLRESAVRHGTKRVEDALANEDLSLDAVATLSASGVSETTIVSSESTGLPGRATSRVVAFGLFKTSSFLPDVAPRVPLACHPEPNPAAEFQTYVCVQARPQQWRREGSVDTQGGAEGRLPFWVSMLADTDDEKNLAAVARLLAFSRRMTLLGFEPTTTDGVRDSAQGGEILGRPEKSEAIAVGLTKHAPWIHPLTHNHPWTLEGKLSIAKVKLGASVSVRSTTDGLGADPNARRVVVWRR